MESLEDFPHGQSASDWPNHVMSLTCVPLIIPYPALKRRQHLEYMNRHVMLTSMSVKIQMCVCPYLLSLHGRRMKINKTCDYKSWKNMVNSIHDFRLILMGWLRFLLCSHSILTTPLFISWTINSSSCICLEAHSGIHKKN